MTDKKQTLDEWVDGLILPFGEFHNDVYRKRLREAAARAFEEAAEKAGYRHDIFELDSQRQVSRPEYMKLSLAQKHECALMRDYCLRRAAESRKGEG